MWEQESREKFPHCRTAEPLTLVVCAECRALTTMGIVSKSWLARGASHILTTHTKKTHTQTPLPFPERPGWPAERPFKRSAMHVCVLKECLCATDKGNRSILAHAHTAPVQTERWLTKLFSFSVSPPVGPVWVSRWWLSMCADPDVLH